MDQETTAVNLHNHNFAVMPIGHTNACPVVLWDGRAGEFANLGGREMSSDSVFFHGERFGFVRAVRADSVVTASRRLRGSPTRFRP